MLQGKTIEWQEQHRLLHSMTKEQLLMIMEEGILEMMYCYLNQVLDGDLADEVIAVV